MKDYEMLYTTKLYLQKLSNGVNPLDGTDLPQESFLNDINLCRSFRFAEDLLDQVIRNNGTVKTLPNSRKEPFRITEEQRNRIQVSEEPVGVAVIAQRITDWLDPNVKSVPGVHITEWLVFNGFLTMVTEPQTGDTVKVATEDGIMEGIRTEERKTRDGRTYRKNFYNKHAQQLILDNLENIAAFEQRRKAEAAG